MLQKPKRGWWVVPGGKVEPTETIQEAVLREFHEETNLLLKNPTLKGVFTIILKDNNQVIEEWMLITYFADSYSGELTLHCNEGILKWVDINDVFGLPKAKGDNVYLRHILNTNQFISGKFYYTPQYELISYKIDHKLETVIV